MTEREKEMTCEETIAENRRLERELRAMTEDNERLRSEVAAAQEKLRRNHENWRIELAKAKAEGRISDSSDSEEIDIDLPGLMRIHLKGRAALRFAGIEVPDVKTQKMAADLPLDDPC